eukprot:PITA_02701
MIEEYRAVIDNNTWKLVDFPQNVKPIGCKWVYRIKYNQKGELEKYKGKYLVILVMYVGDLIITRNNDDHIAQVKKELHAGLRMTDLGLLHYYLGVEVFQHPHHIFISQSKYATEVLQRFGMQDCKPILTPMEKNLRLSKFEGGKVDSTTYR